MQLWRWPLWTSASNRVAPIRRASSSVEATMPAPSAAAVMTSSDREKPCWATTCPELVMSNVSRAALSARKVSSGSHHPRLERAHQARRPAASIISSRARPRFASGPTTATSTRSSGPGAARTLPDVAPEMDERRPAHPGALRRPGQATDQAASERRGGLPVHTLHELLGDHQPVAGRDDQRAADARRPG